MRRLATCARPRSGLSFVVCAAVALAPATAAAAQSSTTVPIRVLRRDGNVVALAPVTIRARSYFFVVDTGASVTVIGRRAARRLRLATLGRPVRLGGVFGAGTGTPVRIRRWRLGTVRLPARRIIAADVGASGRIVGLLGSDVLARFGRVTIDYANRTLTLGS